MQVKFVRRCATAHLQHVNSSEKVVTTDEKVVTINNSRSPVEPVKWIYGYGAPETKKDGVKETVTKALNCLAWASR